MTIVQVDIVLAEDLKTVLAYGYTDDEDVTYVQSVTLPMTIEEANLDPDEWRAAVRADRWRVLA